jgi:hypothetical protein
MKRFFRWLTSKITPQKASPAPSLRKPAAHLPQTGAGAASRKVKMRQALPARQPEVIDFDAASENQIDDLGPGKNVLIRKYVREDTGTHETLTILDDSAIDTEEVAGIDPYNTGRFDRSKNWDKRFRKD